MDKDKRTYIVLEQNGSEFDDYSMDNNLAASLSIALALRKFTNESPGAQRNKENDSILWKYTTEIKSVIYNLALQYKIIAPNNSENHHIQYNLIRCFHIPHKKDETLLRLCNLLIFLYSKKSILVDGFGKIGTTEKELIENAVLQQFFESLNVSHKIEYYARLITWSSPNPPEELEIKQVSNGSFLKEDQKKSQKIDFIQFSREWIAHATIKGAENYTSAINAFVVSKHNKSKF